MTFDVNTIATLNHNVHINLQSQSLGVSTLKPKYSIFMTNSDNVDKLAFVSRSDFSTTLSVGTAEYNFAAKYFAESNAAEKLYIGKWGQNVAYAPSFVFGSFFIKDAGFWRITNETTFSILKGISESLIDVGANAFSSCTTISQVLVVLNKAIALQAQNDPWLVGCEIYQHLGKFFLRTVLPSVSVTDVVTVSPTVGLGKTLMDASNGEAIEGKAEQTADLIAALDEIRVLSNDFYYIHVQDCIDYIIEFDKLVNYCQIYDKFPVVKFADTNAFNTYDALGNVITSSTVTYQQSTMFEVYNLKMKGLFMPIPERFFKDSIYGYQDASLIGSIAITYPGSQGFHKKRLNSSATFNVVDSERAILDLMRASYIEATSADAFLFSNVAPNGDDFNQIVLEHYIKWRIQSDAMRVLLNRPNFMNNDLMNELTVTMQAFASELRSNGSIMDAGRMFYQVGSRNYVSGDGNCIVIMPEEYQIPADMIASRIFNPSAITGAPNFVVKIQRSFDILELRIFTSKTDNASAI